MKTSNASAIETSSSAVEPESQQVRKHYSPQKQLRQKVRSLMRARMRSRR